MDFKFFDSVSDGEAVEFLNNFLQTQREAVKEMINGPGPKVSLRI